MARTDTARSASGTSIVTVALCYFIAVFEGFDLQAAGVAAPKLGPAFAMTPGQLGWFFSMSTFGLMVGAAIGGRLSDRFGRKTVLIGSIVAFGLMSIGNALSPNVEALLVFRFLTGMGLGGALPNLVALVAENTAPERKNAMVGLLYAGLPTGGALVSAMSLLGGAENWQLVFAIGGLAPLLIVPLVVLLLPESRQLQAVKAVEPEAGGRGFAFALFQENRAARTLLLWGAFFLSLLTMYILLNWLPTLLVGRGLSRPQASLVQMSFNVLGACASYLTGVLMDRLPFRTVVLISFVTAAAGLVLLAVAPAQIGVSLIVGGVVGATMSMTQAMLYALAPANYPTRVRGTGVGSAVAAGRLGSAVGPLLAGVLLGGGASPQQVLTVLIPIIAVAGLGAFVLVVLMGGAELRRLAEA
ncbi:MAG TPA: 3-(3-hydroxy-phenyl)propionate transporter MhpT [Caulobacteraceae bacterium]|jgi:AAHS family 3-hydroxyphenylpropionic acid transporter|nr:3-(3-hydroxy-phenyl)propionate transporter MhpT [Caulobacteraceae bacterium]